MVHFAMTEGQYSSEGLLCLVSIKQLFFFFLLDYVVVGSDSGRIVILEYIPSKNTFEKVHYGVHIRGVEWSHLI